MDNLDIEKENVKKVSIFFGVYTKQFMAATHNTFSTKYRKALVCFINPDKLGKNILRQLYFVSFNATGINLAKINPREN